MESSKRQGPAMRGVIRGGAAKKVKSASSATSKGRSKELMKRFLASGKKAPAKKATKPAMKESGGASVAAGRKARDKWLMKQALRRFKDTPLPPYYSPKNVRKHRKGSF
jgi:hypothetical protein